MAINLYHAVNEDGLFNLLGKAFFAQSTAYTALATTVPTEIDDVLEIHNNLTVDSELEDVAALLKGATKSIKGGGRGAISSLQSYSRQLLIEMAHDDNPLPSKTLKVAMQELIDQMISSSDSVDASAVTVSVAAGGSNTGDGKIICSTKRGDGLVQENMLAEDLEVSITSAGRNASMSVKGERSVSRLHPDWPKGSGAKSSLRAVTADNSLVANGDMEDEDDATNVPDDWVVSVGTIGTTVKMTDVEVQTITIASSPTSGHYTLSWQNADGDTQTTAPIAWNASGGTVQSELRKLAGLEKITVSSSGTSPNFTHTVTFAGRGGNVAELTATNNLDTGTVTPATTSAGTAEVFYAGKALHIDSDGAELTTLNAPVTLKPETAYAVSLWAITDSIPAAGVFTIDLVDGIGGTVIQDSEGTSNSFTFNAADLTTSWQHLDDLVSGEIVFRTPRPVPATAYLRIRISTAVSNTSSVFFDEVALSEMTELYPGGPMAAAFAGKTAWTTDDEYTITVTNDRAGLLQEHFNRNFDMAGLGMLLPSDTGGSETVPDTVVA